MVNVCGGLVSDPPLSVPPSSCNRTVTVATPFALAAGVYVSVPFGAIAGCVENKALLVFETHVGQVKSTTCAASFAGPALIAVAQLPPFCAPASSTTV